MALGRAKSFAFGCVGNLKLMLMRSKIRDRGLLAVPAGRRGSSEETKLLFEAVASAVFYCVCWERGGIAADLGEDAS